MNATRKRLLMGGVITLLGVMALLEWSETRSAASRLATDRETLLELQDKLRDIRQFADTPRVAALELESPDRILNRIYAALEEAGLPERTLANQSPFRPQRIGRSDFKLRRVEIQLKPATLPKIVAFCQALRDESTGSVVRDLRIDQPQRQGERETWSSQLTLTQIIFSPKSEG
jgi:hypothetical protein